MYGIGAVKYKDFTIGYIEKNSFDLGGKKPEAAKIEAEQVQGAPVLVIPQSNGGIAPTFNVETTYHPADGKKGNRLFSPRLADLSYPKRNASEPKDDGNAKNGSPH